MAGFADLSRLTELSEEKLKDVFDAIYHLAKAGDRVRLRKFGAFFMRHRPARRIVFEGKEIRTKESMILWFKPSPNCIEEVKARVTARKADE